MIGVVLAMYIFIDLQFPENEVLIVDYTTPRPVSIINNEKEKYKLSPHTWYLTKLKNKKHIDYFEISNRDKVLVKTLLSNEVNYNNIVGRVIFKHK